MNYVFIVVLPTNTIKFILNQRITELWPICRHWPICVSLPQIRLETEASAISCVEVKVNKSVVSGEFANKET